MQHYNARAALTLFLIGLSATVLSIFLFEITGFVRGMDYRIMQYFSDLMLAGENPFTSPSPFVNHAFEHSALQALSMQAVFFFDIKYGWNAFHIYQYLNIMAALLAALILVKLGQISHKHVACVMMLSVLNPLVFWYLLVLPSDKFFLLLMPLLLLACCLLWWHMACFLCGIFAAFAGVPVFCAPIILAYRARKLDGSFFGKFLSWPIVIGGGLMLLGFVIGMAPYFPESLDGWMARSAREGHMPFWFSIWSLVDGIYLPNMNKLISMLVVIWLFYLYWQNKISTTQALILSFCTFLILSNSQILGRILPILALLALCFSGGGASLGICHSNVAVVDNDHFCDRIYSMALRQQRCWI